MVGDCEEQPAMPGGVGSWKQSDEKVLQGLSSVSYSACINQAG